MYLISIYFDEQANRKLQALIDEIVEKTGNTFMTENHVPPHMTISAFEARNDEDAVKALERIAERMHPFDIKIVSTGMFFPYVMYAQAVLNEGLANLADIAYEEVSKIPDAIISKTYKPYSWLPHITMGKKLSEEQMKLAFEIMQKKFFPVEAKIVEIGVAKPNPHRDLKRVSMSEA